MARGRSSRSSQQMRSAQRGANDTTNDSLSVLAPLLSPVEDLRAWNPEPLVIRVPLDVRGVAARFVVSPSVSVHKRPIIARDRITGGIRGVQLPVGVTVQSPFPVVTCVRRAMRRAVLFAKGKTGKGSRKRFRHRNSRTYVRC